MEFIIMCRLNNLIFSIILHEIRVEPKFWTEKTNNDRGRQDFLQFNSLASGDINVIDSCCF